MWAGAGWRIKSTSLRAWVSADQLCRTVRQYLINLTKRVRERARERGTETEREIEGDRDRERGSSYWIIDKMNFTSGENYRAGKQ